MKNIEHIPELDLEKVLDNSNEILVEQYDEVERKPLRFYAKFLRFKLVERAYMFYTESRENQYLPQPRAYFERVFSVVGKDSKEGLLYAIGEGIVFENPSKIITLQVPKNLTVQSLKDKIGLPYEKIMFYRKVIIEV